MSINTALFERLVELRRRYTGESETTARHELTAGLRPLSYADLSRLAAAMDDDVPMPGRLRAAVLPDATLLRQQELESAVFEALCQTAHLDRSEDSPAHNSWTVRPHREYLVLYLPPDSTGMLVRKLLPSGKSDEATGYPGLRARTFGRHVELYFADGTPEVAVHLALAHMGRGRAGHDWLADDMGRLTPADERAAPVSRTSPGTARLGSALLRRLALFSQLPLAVLGHHLCYLDWRGAPSRTELAELLTHPVTGIGATGYLRAANHVVVDAECERLVLRGSGHSGCAQPARATDQRRPMDGAALGRPLPPAEPRTGSHQPKRPEM